MLRVKQDFLFNNLRNLLVCKRNLNQLKQLKQKLHWWNSTPTYHNPPIICWKSKPYPKKKWYYPRRRSENQKVNTCYKKLKKPLKEKVDGYA